MAEIKVLPRSDVPVEARWNAESVFKTLAAWETEAAAIVTGLSEVTRYAGQLVLGAEVVANALEARDRLINRAGTLAMWAGVEYATDSTDQAAGARQSKAQGIFGQVLAAVAFVEPELLGVGRTELLAWADVEPRLAIYRQYIEDLFRKQAHVRSVEVEELLGMLADPFAGASNASSMLKDADLQFAPARATDGSEVPLSQSSFGAILERGDREARRTAWENYNDAYLAHKNTLAATLATSIKQNVFQMRARRHSSTLAASLFESNIPLEVFHNLITTFRKNLPTWHRYWRVRRKGLGVETLHPYDIWAPLTQQQPTVPYAQAVDWICEGLAPLGADYVDAMRRGALAERWVDAVPNLGKFSGAFSSGNHGTYPFIVMSYTDDINSLSTLAHELGHSMHSYLTWQTQPVIYSDYSLFAAEVASNFHQAMVRAHLLQTHQDPAFQISVIEEAMSNFHRYFFIMPTLARFELETHERTERGDGLSADDLNDLMVDLFSEGYGGEMHVDRARTGITWATFGHLYADYYVYQYATGISGAHAIAGRILSGTPNAAQDYRKFLSAGSSMYPLEALKMAGVDLSTSEPVEQAFATLAGLVDRLESLVG